MISCRTLCNVTSKFVRLNRRRIHVLGIESSCDDTGVAIVKEDGQILSNCIHSQLKQHLLNGGIIPVLAKEYHLNNIDRIANEAFKKSGLKSVEDDIDAIAVSTRPGLQFSLQIGLNYARTLAKKYSKPLIPIHHMQAHATMPLLQNRSIKFPFLALLISGGHCLISIAKRIDEFHLLGSSLDDAPGDILDKCARRFRLRNLGPPFDSISGGAAIELLSQREGADRFKYFTRQNEFSIPMLTTPSCDFSFSGYHSGLDIAAPVFDELWQSGNRADLLTELSHLCSSLQRVMLVQIVRKLHRAIMYYRMYWRYENEDAFLSSSRTQHLGYGLQDIDCFSESVDLVVSGGVAANKYIVDGILLACRECFEEPNMKVYAPSRSLCSDNGLMVAWNGMLRYRNSLCSNPQQPPIIDQETYGDIDESIIYDSNQMESVEVKAVSPMGIDISDKLKSIRFKIKRIQHPEFKTIKS